VLRGISISRLLRFFSLQTFSALLVVATTVVGPQLGVLYADSLYTVSGTVSAGTQSVSDIEVALGYNGLNPSMSPIYPLTDSSGNYSISNRGDSTYPVQLITYQDLACRDGTGSCNTFMSLDLDAKKAGGPPVTVNGSDVTQNFSIPTVPLTVPIRGVDGNLDTGGGALLSSQSGQAVDTNDSSITYVTDSAAATYNRPGVFSRTMTDGNHTINVVPGFTYKICVYAFTPNDNLSYGGCKTTPVSIVSATSVEVDLFASNLTASLQAQKPVLAWDGPNLTSPQTYYVIYRNGTQIDTTNEPSYTDNNAPAGTNTYYINTYARGTYGTPTNTVSVSATPTAPTNLTATSPTQNPALSWDAVSAATSYNIYRNGSLIDSVTTSNTTSYTDYNAPEGTNTYFVTAVNSGGESGHSSSVGVLVDRTAPTITYAVSPTPNSSGWNNSGPVTVTFTCADNSGGSGIASCTSPQTESADGTYTLTGTATDNAGNSANVSATVKIDSTLPTVANVTLATDPLAVNNTTTLSANVTDNAGGSGISKAEYYTGTDPGAGNGTAMSLTGGTASATVGSYATAGMHTYYVRAQDNAGNWSTPMSVTLDVYNPAGGYAAGHGSVVPNGPTSNTNPSDVLPTETGNNLKANFDFTVKYVNSTDTTPTGTSAFTWGSTCNNPHANCFVVTTDTTVTPAIGSLAWLVVPGDNTTTFQGTASVSQGSTSLGTNYPVRIRAHPQFK
jgi:fibronectin type 3 domain-containing protein